MTGDDYELELDEVRQRFSDFGRTCRRRAPLYAVLSREVAARPELAELLLVAPTDQRLPVLFFAAVHDLLLGGADAALADWYGSVRDRPRAADDPELLPALEAFVEARRDELLGLLRSRSTQTNEVGRCAAFLPALGLLAAEVGPLGLLDVGASAGLNLLLDSYAYRYTDPDGVVTEVGGPSPVTVATATRGPVPVPTALPEVVGRIGVDLAPVDVRDPRQTRWLKACVWPDQRDRFDRLAAALALAADDPPALLAGDAVARLADAVDAVAGHPVVLNSWVLNYLRSGQRLAYLAELDRLGADRDLSWVYVETPGLVGGLPAPAEGDPQRTVLTLVRWRSGDRTDQHLATCHPHGYWLHWH